jgi:stage II sporulation protein E
MGSEAKTLYHISMDIPRQRKLAALLATEAAAALLGGLLAHSEFAGGAFESAAPFAIALAAAGSIRYLGMEVFGVAAGCLLFLPHPANVAAMAAAAVAGLVNLAMRKLGLRRKVFVPFCAFACSLASGAICVISGQPKPPDWPTGAMAWLYAFCGAVLCGCSAYFIILAQAGLSGGAEPGALRPHSGVRMNRRERAALLLCCSRALAAGGGVALGGVLFRPAHVLAVLFVLAAAYCWRESGGAIAGCCAGAALALAGDEPAFTAVFALGGLLAGVFSGMHTERDGKGKMAENALHGNAIRWLFAKNNEEFPTPSALLTVPVAGGFALVCIFFVALRAVKENDPADTVLFSIESLAAILCFICMPLRVWNALRRRFAAPEERLAPLESEAALQLTQTAGALRKVGEYVEEVAQGLEKLQLPSEQGIYTSAAEEVCRLCPEYPYCHEENLEAMVRLSGSYLKRLRRYGGLSAEDLEQARRDCGLTQPCRHPEHLRQALSRAYDIHCAQKAGNKAESQLRQAAAAQFDALSGLLEELSAKLSRQKAFDAETAEAAARVLEDHGFRARSVVCAHGEEMAAQLQAMVLPETEHSSREQLTSAIGRATGIAFELPALTEVRGDGESLLTFAQSARYTLQTGAVQMSSSRSDYCGDYFDCFNDSRGHEVLVISDGMGTGGRAAVDSALATEIFSLMVRSGLSFSGAVRMANQALLLKSHEESLATLDAAGVNLYTGEVEFCKAGGAASYVRRRGKAAQVQLSALPAGILRSIHPAGFRAVLEPGDLLVLVSDGMLCDDGRDQWLCEQLEGWENGDMQALAEHLAATAVRLRQEAHQAARALQESCGGPPALPEREDDLTVICARLDAGGRQE